MVFNFDLTTLWFLLIGLLLTVYAILDGFDLGVGMLLLRAKSDHDRRILLNSIGPVWDGNEVWLLVGGGAMFAAFPEVYATVFSGFYIPFMLLLLALIFRAAAIEFRSKETSHRWRTTWDIAFSAASFLIAILMGVALSNIAVGIPLDSQHEYSGGFFNLLHPHALILAATTVGLFMLHGAIYLVMKTEGELQMMAKQWAKSSMVFFGVCYGLLTIATLIFQPHMAAKVQTTPWLIILPLATFMAIANIPREVTRGAYGMAFASSSASIALLMGLFGLSLYPRMVPSFPNPENSLTITNGAATPMTLTTMTIIAGIGIPFVIAYTIAVYKVFYGKVDTEHMHY